MISIITPSHKRANLLRAYESLKAQTVKEFEWVILLNGEEANIYGASKDEVTTADTQRVLGFEDARVKIFLAPRSIKENIGWLKKKCCELSLGDIYLELDHDDLLTENCLEEVQKAFADTSIDMVYSDTFHVREDGKPFQFKVTVDEKEYDVPFSTYWGWHYGEKEGKVFTISKDPSPASMSFIWFAPDHVRAWKASFYNSIGGHDTEIGVADDFDLCCRTYIAGKMHHINQPLYYYYHNEKNTSGQKDEKNQNAKIQELTHVLHDKYISDILLKWCKLNDLKALDLGGRFGSPEGYTSVDLLDAEIVLDLEKPWDAIQDNSVGVLRASHVLEHLHDTIHFFNEAYRVLAPGGFLLIEVPSVSGTGAFSDPTHVKFFNQRSFRYYTDENIGQYIRPQFTGRFQLNRIKEWTWPNDDVTVIGAHMICLKPPYSDDWVGAKLM